MYHRSLFKTFTRPELRFLTKSIYLGSSSRIHQSVTPFSTTKPAFAEEKIKIKFILKDGKQIETDAKVGDSLLDVVVNNELNIEGFGACEGTLTCSTCHVILKPEDYKRLPDQPCDEECDMLDLAYGLTDTSRLGCQITLTKDMDGLEIQVPDTINDARS